MYIIYKKYKKLQNFLKLQYFWYILVRHRSDINILDQDIMFACNFLVCCNISSDAEGEFLCKIVSFIMTPGSPAGILFVSLHFIG